MNDMVKIHNKTPRTLKDAFGDQHSWKSDYDRRRELARVLEWCFVVALVVVGAGIVVSQL